jgi:D-alanyl-D-alanine carboxypeptidase (penicillin-binding protein 5/6)
MGADSRDIRNAAATKLLDWGFANYGVYSYAGEKFDGIRVLGGAKSTLAAESAPYSIVAKKSDLSKIEKKSDIPSEIGAPIKKGDVVGSVSFSIGESELGKCDVISTEDIEKISFFELWYRLLAKFLLK